MYISVWDTYVQRQDGKVMHFDILVSHDLKDTSKIFSFGKDYLKSKPFKTGELTSRECQFCHIEKASEEVVASINNKGYFILEMQNCN